MSSTITEFFSKDENLSVLKRFHLELESTHELPAPSPSVVAPLKQLIRAIMLNTRAFDLNCAANINWIGMHFISQIEAYSQFEEDKKPVLLASIFVSAYRFLCELDFSQPGDLSFELGGVKKFALDNHDKFPEDLRRELIYANYTMPISVLKELSRHPELSDFNNFSETAKTARDLKETWDKELKTKNEEIELLNNNLNRVATAYNFVGLVKGFEGLATAKKQERKNCFIALIALGIIMTIPVAAQLWFVITHIDTIDSHRNTLIYSLPPLIALEVILIYLFRVVLMQYKGISTQLLQINLRVSLCQFIQNYADYSSKIKKQDPSALEKFENLIFSGIISESESLPSTFDGVEQISKLISSIRSGK